MTTKDYEAKRRADIKYAKIYKIVCKNTKKVYYGSTCFPELKRRLQGHEQHFKNFFEKDNYCYISSYEILCEGNYVIELVENVNCKTKKELHKRERWYIENNECVNTQIPIRTLKESSKYQYEKNKDKISERNKIKHICNICGGTYTLQHKARHNKSKKHLKCQI